MAVIEDPDDLSQGGSTAVTDAVFGSPTGVTVTITSGANELPSITAGDFFEIRDHSNAQNNGLYKETGGTPSTNSITADKVSGAAPIAAASEAITTLGTNADEKSVFYDTAAREIYLLEQGNLNQDGVTGQAAYSFTMISWKDDPFLIANAPFPMLVIDADAGKMIVGQDASGNNNGWNFADNGTYFVRTRKLLRNMGWTEVDTSGNELAVWPCFITLGGFEDPVGDIAYYQFGNDTTVDDTVNFDFAGPVNEAVQAFERLDDGSINGGSGVTISADGRTMTRSDSGNWRTDGFKVGGRILLRDSENNTNDGVFASGGSFLLSAVQDSADGAITIGTAADSGTGFDFVDGGGGNDSIVRNDGVSWVDEGYFVGGNVTVANANTVANDGTYTILAITDSTIDVATASLTADTGDNTATFGPLDPTGSPDTTVNAAIDNLNGITLRLRVRDSDPNGKTFGQANLASAGKTVLGGLVFSFPLANAQDLKISADDTTIDSSGPYTGMSLTIHSTPQSLGGGGYLVGGPYNFGFEIDGNSGTDQQVYEWLQRQLRRLTDIDADADTAIGRAIDGLMRFLGDALQVGSTDGGLTFPTNPQGGGSGVIITNLNASSRNTTTYYDNTGTSRSHPIGTPVTLDFNQTLVDDTVAEYTLYYDRTIRNQISDLVITAGTGAAGTFDSAGGNLPVSLDNGVGAYVRVTGLTGADAAMNGIYQVTALTSANQWDVLRYDNDDIVTTSSANVPVDEHPVDSPDAIVVQDDTSTDVQGLAGSDFTFTFAYSLNSQGGRTPGTDAQVVARAIGQETAQFAQSSVATIPSATATTIPVTAQIERNFNNP